LIKSLAEMLRSYFQHLLADDVSQSTRQPEQVRERTAALRTSNEALQAQRRTDALNSDHYQEQLRKRTRNYRLQKLVNGRAIAGI
jgi:uncharacterized protein YlxW (UPF0749 family)